MKKNNNKKGFTIVELVIVIAVIAILAAVLIPTFAGIIDKANESADKQAVRQMNIALAAESVEKKPETVGEVVDILANAGFNSREKLVPVSAGHGFYWCAAANMITLIRDEGDESPELIFPTEEAALNEAFEAANAETKSAINFGANKGDPSTDRTFFDFEPVVIERYPSEETSDETVEPVTPEGTQLVIGDLIYSDEDEAYLLPAGTYYLADRTDINVPVVTEGEVTINLNGQELYINDSSNETNGASHAIDVQGTLNIVNNANTGTVILNQENTAYDQGQCGINVDGTLNLNGVNVTCNRRCNIENYGTTNLTNSKFTVKNGTGLYSMGGDTVISGGEFVASGSGVTPILSAEYYSGTMEISGTEFTEENSATYSQAVIVWGSTEGLVLTDVKMETTQANVAAYSSCVTIKGGSFGGSLTGLPLVIQANDVDEYGTFAGLVTLSGSGNSISGGEFTGLLTFGQYSKTTITGGTFTGGLSCSGCNGVYTEVVINDGTFSNTLEFNDWSDVKINGGKFNSVLTLKRTPAAGINIYIKYGTTFGETTLSATTGDSAVYTVPAGDVFSINSVTKGTDGWTIS